MCVGLQSNRSDHLTNLFIYLFFFYVMQTFKALWNGLSGQVLVCPFLPLWISLLAITCHNNEMSQCAESDDSYFLFLDFFLTQGLRSQRAIRFFCCKSKKKNKKKQPNNRCWHACKVSESTRKGDTCVEIQLKIPIICFVSVPSSGLFFPFSVGFLRFLSCHSGMLVAFHCKFKAHSSNHWRRPGNLHLFVR